MPGNAAIRLTYDQDQRTPTIPPIFGRVSARLGSPPPGPALHAAGQIGILSRTRTGTVRRLLSVLAGAATQGIMLATLFGGILAPTAPAEPPTIEMVAVPPAPPDRAQPDAEAPDAADTPPAAAVKPELDPPDPVVPPPAVPPPLDASAPPVIRAMVPTSDRRPRPHPAVHRPTPPTVLSTAVPAQAVSAATNASLSATNDAASAERQMEETLRGRIRDAVQQAVRCPAAASTMGLSGKAAIAFDYRDGSLLSDAQLIRSAGVPMLDAAALTAVRGAHYPKPPPREVGHALRLLIWVEEACGG